MNPFKHRVKRSGIGRRLILLLSVLMLFFILFSLFHDPASRVAAEAASETTNLLNGSFEEGQNWSASYRIMPQSTIPAWNTTANDGKIELFMENNGYYIKNSDGSAVRLKPSDGSYAAELNASEESSLYQIVKTSPSSVYEWGLDHGARLGTDTMALIIGPNQSVAPAKADQYSRDQFMQLVDWLVEQNLTSIKTEAGLGEILTVYSKTFGPNGTFKNNADHQAFSLTPSSIYSEQWKVWIMADTTAALGVNINPWGHYGSNETGSSGTGVDLNKYYFYDVPAGQTETLFAFVSVGCTVLPSTPNPLTKLSYGNFIDNINFKYYHAFSGTTSDHGAAIISKSDGVIESEGGSGKLTVNDKVVSYIPDGEPLQIQAIVEKADADAGCQFVGLYRTFLDENGNSVTQFIKVFGNFIDDTGSLTEAEKKGKWVRSTNAAGDMIYTYLLEDVSSSTDLHFIFIKSPTVTYDTNGGQAYEIVDRPHLDEAANVYSFKPLSDVAIEDSFIAPYVSKAAVGKNDGWKFMGWKLTGDIVDGIGLENELVNADQLGTMLLPAEHTIACDYKIEGAAGDSMTQYFKIYAGDVACSKTVTKDASDIVTGAIWQSGEEKLYANVHRGLTMVAQWRWRQALIPQLVDNGGTISDSIDGGTVAFTSVVDPSNYNGAFTGNGGVAYFAEMGEQVIIKATEKPGHKFIGWYDESGNLITTNQEYLFTVNRENVKTYYARFSNSVTQTYIRQIRNGAGWDETDDDAIGIIDRYSYTDAVGSMISATATAGSGYRFVGWYDEAGNPVEAGMLTNDGATIWYTTTGDKIYYARFDDAYTLNVSKIDGDLSTAENKVPLADAEFTLYQKDAGGDQIIRYQEESISCSVVGVAVSAMNGGGTEAVAAFKDQLEAGKEYYLVETRAPSGYRLLDTSVKIVLDDAGANALIDGTPEAILGKAISVEFANYSLPIMPTTGLPFTGGWFAATGLALMLAAVIGLLGFYAYRQKEK